MANKTVTTLHGRQDLRDNRALYFGFDTFPLVSISDDQRRPLPHANYAATIHHGIPKNLLGPNYATKEGYLAFLGRIAPEKRPDRAIAIARAAGMPLKIAAKIDRVDEAYFQATIKPLLQKPGIEFVGEINDQQKSQFLGNASGLLFPIDWPEPFGLVMIEAMACGTPVLALNRGSVPEIIEPGITGCLVDTVQEAIGAIPDLLALDRRQIRRRFEEKFLAGRMARDYTKLYQRLTKAGRKSDPAWLTDFTPSSVARTPHASKQLSKKSE
jgi:glycosyltransferase involved in cell wall biosynthesis